MSKVCVITGGGSGIGLSAAKFLGEGWIALIAGRTQAKLEAARNELESFGVPCVPFVCDVSNEASVRQLLEKAVSLGSVEGVIHAAGIDPNMGSAAEIFDINAMGTIYINEAFLEVIADGGSIVDVSSMAGHLLPDEAIPSQEYSTSLVDKEAFRNKMQALLAAAPEDRSRGTAYSISKNFVIWYAVQSAFRGGKRQLRVVSVSPGTFLTPMGILGGEHSASYAKRGALGRTGEADEIGRLIAFLVAGNASYLTAVDILCDGGTIAALKGKIDSAVA
jgi:NAD(P)-dependent dehydrogenase (short-subunit alcohol dehydrogenase family)